MSAWEMVPASDEFEGFTEAEVDEYLNDVFDEICDAVRMRVAHDRDSFLAHAAGGDQCKALGHTPTPETGWYDDERHPLSWDGDPLCADTRYSDACSYCESADCDGGEYLAMSTLAELWALVGG